MFHQSIGYQFSVAPSINVFDEQKGVVFHDPNRLPKCVAFTFTLEKVGTLSSKYSCNFFFVHNHIQVPTNSKVSVANMGTRVKVALVGRIGIFMVGPQSLTWDLGNLPLLNLLHQILKQLAQFEMGNLSFL